MAFISLPVARLALFFCLLLAAAPASAQVSCPQANSPGPPVTHNQRIFWGEIDAAGRAVGFHSRPGGINPNSVSGGTIGVEPGTPVGVYRMYNFLITEGGRTRVKALSTMFPDACSQAAVLAAIRNAAAGAGPNRQFIGPSGTACQAGNPPVPFNIRGYTDAAGNIIVAYPNY